jgi:hypothetical protein
MPAALQADELGHVFQVLAKDVLITARQNRHGASAKFAQSRLCRGIVQYIERDEVDGFFRKKLFRSQATASPGLGEKNEFIAGVFHSLIVT